MNDGAYRNLTGEEVHDGDVVTPSVAEQSRNSKRTQTRLEQAAGKTTKMPSEDQSTGFEGSSTQENKHG